MSKFCVIMGEQNVDTLCQLVQDAAREKAAAGEGRNVEHVAEADDITHTADTKKRKKTSIKQKSGQPALPDTLQTVKRSRKHATNK